MTYRHYIAKEKKTDSLATWKEYLEQYHDIYKLMPATLKVDHAKRTYGTRFEIQF